MPASIPPLSSSTAAPNAAAWGGTSTSEAIRLSADLHERLALGAKMLGAFDLQMRRCESSIAEQESFARRIEEAGQQASNGLGDLLRRAEETGESFGRRLDAVVAERVGEWERTLAARGEEMLRALDLELESRRARVAADEHRLAEAEQRLRRLEESLADASERHASEIREHTEQFERQRQDAAVAVRAAGGELLNTLQRAEQVRHALEEDLRQRSDLLQRCRELDREIRDSVERQLVQVRECGARLDNARNELSPQAEQARLLGDRLELLLAALREWTPLLENQLPDRLREQAELAFRDGARRLEEKVDRVAHAFQSLSQLLGGPQWDLQGARGGSGEGRPPHGD